MDASSKKIITRQKLYELVWQRPTTLLALEFGLSDVGFAKLCKRNGIPRPPRGYWAMLQVGKAPPREGLPMPTRDWDIQISGHVTDTGSEVLVSGNDTVSKNKSSDEPVLIAETLRNAHPLVKASMPVLRVARCNDYGLVIPVPGCVCINVSRMRLRRALLIMDALLRYFEQRGYSVTCPADGGKPCQTRVELMGVGVPFRIDEFLLEKADGLSATSGAKESYRLHRPYKYRNASPSGRLLLSVDEDRCDWNVRWSGLHLKWSDGKKQRLEDLLGNFAAEVVRVATYMKTKKEEHEKWEQERQLEQERKAELERHRQEMIARIKEEKRKVLELREEAAGWNESRTLRQYIEAVRQNAVKRGVDIGADSETGRWLVWAIQQADRLDPLTESPPSVLDEAEKYKEEKPSVFGNYSSGTTPYYQDEAEKRSEFFRKRWLYDRFNGRNR